MTDAGGQRRAAARRRTEKEIEGAFRDDPDPVVRDPFLFVKDERYGGQFHSGEPVTVPKFNFYVSVRRLNGTVGLSVAFEYRQGWDFVRVFLNWQKYEVPESALAALRNELRAALGGAIDTTAREPAAPLSALRGNLPAFKAAFVTFRDAVEAVG